MPFAASQTHTLARFNSKWKFNKSVLKTLSVEHWIRANIYADEPLCIGEIGWLCMRRKRAIFIRHTFDETTTTTMMMMITTTTTITTTTICDSTKLNPNILWIFRRWRRLRLAFSDFHLFLFCSLAFYSLCLIKFIPSTVIAVAAKFTLSITLFCIFLLQNSKKNSHNYTPSMVSYLYWVRSERKSI